MQRHQRLQLNVSLQFLKFASLAAIIFLCVRAASATVLIVVYTEDGYWLGADSIRSSLTSESQNTVCKIHETRFGILLKSGAGVTVGPANQTSSVDAEIQDTLAKSKTVDEFKKTIRAQYKHDIQVIVAKSYNVPVVAAESLEMLKMSHPIPNRDIDALSRTILLFEPSKRGEILDVSPGTQKIDDYFKNFTRVNIDWAPVESLAQRQLPLSVRMFGEQRPYYKPDDWVRTHPQQAMREMFQIAHSEDPNHVGPPYVMVHVIQAMGGGKPRIDWVSKGACPSWTRAISP
jgi:hypothetical protein